MAERFFKRSAVHSIVLCPFLRRVVLLIQGSRSQSQHTAVIAAKALLQAFVISLLTDHLIFIELKVRGGDCCHLRVAHHLLVDVFLHLIGNAQIEVSQQVILSGDIFSACFKAINKNALFLIIILFQNPLPQLYCLLLPVCACCFRPSLHQSVIRSMLRLFPF